MHFMSSKSIGSQVLKTCQDTKHAFHRPKDETLKQHIFHETLQNGNNHGDRSDSDAGERDNLKDSEDEFTSSVSETESETTSGQDDERDDELDEIARDLFFTFLNKMLACVMAWRH